MTMKHGTNKADASEVSLYLECRACGDVHIMHVKTEVFTSIMNKKPIGLTKSDFERLTIYENAKLCPKCYNQVFPDFTPIKGLI